MQRSQETTNALVHEKLEDIGKDVKEIKEQTIKTNGRVTNLESVAIFIKGALAVMTTIIIPVVLMVIKLYLDGR